LLQIYFRLWECKIYQNQLRFARVTDKSLLPRFLCPTVYCGDSFSGVVRISDTRGQIFGEAPLHVPSSSLPTYPLFNVKHQSQGGVLKCFISKLLDCVTFWVFSRGWAPMLPSPKILHPGRPAPPMSRAREQLPLPVPPSLRHWILPFRRRQTF